MSKLGGGRSDGSVSMLLRLPVGWQVFCIKRFLFKNTAIFHFLYLVGETPEAIVLIGSKNGFLWMSENLFEVIGLK